MRDTHQHVRDHGHPRKYWTQVPNLVDDSDLSPYARTVYLHYLRISGRQDSCEETTRETAEHCCMSRSSVANARAELTCKGWIEVENLGTYGRGADQVIHLLDRWGENMARYSQTDHSELGIVHHMDNSLEPPATNGIVQPVDIPAGPVDIPAGPVVKTNSSSFLTPEEEKTGEEDFSPPGPPSLAADWTCAHCLDLLPKHAGRVVLRDGRVICTTCAAGRRARASPGRHEMRTAEIQA
jgi:hypothetical protein